MGEWEGGREGEREGEKEVWSLSLSLLLTV